MTPARHFLDIWRLDTRALRAILDDAAKRKRLRRDWAQARVDADAAGAGRSLAMIFQRNSTRTRFSFDAAIRQLGGSSILATGADLQLGRGETVEDTARTLSRMVDAVMIRSDNHSDLERFALAAGVPVINGLSDKSHPCQILADIMTFEEHRGPIAGKTIAWVGDSNNVCASFIHAAARFGFRLVIACPPQYHPDLLDLARAEQEGGAVDMTDDVRAAVAGADCVVTDTWVSMSDGDHEARVEAFEPFQVDEALMDLASPDAIFLHCLPAHRGEEVTDGVIDGPRSVVWDEAENRIHAQKGILAWCFGGVE
ncbi:MAG TPA: ornithine carbamoyltransferase [Caulobacteraceae bacterium]